MQVRYILLISIVSFLVGGAVAKRYMPTEVTKEVTKNHIVTVIKERVLPDGSKETETVINDDSVKKEEKKVVDLSKSSNLIISGGVGSGLDLKPFYVLQVQKRVLGPLFVGAQVSTEGKGLLLIGVEF